MVDEEAGGRSCGGFCGHARTRVLMLRDEENARKGYEHCCRMGYEVLASEMQKTRWPIEQLTAGSMIADVDLPGINGLDLLGQLGRGLWQTCDDHHHRKRQRRTGGGRR